MVRGAIRKIFIKPGLEGEQDFSKVSGEDERMGITRVWMRKPAARARD